MLSVVTLARRLQLSHDSVLFTLNAKKDSATLDEKCSKSSLCTVEQLYNKASVTIHKRANSSHEDLNRQPEVSKIIAIMGVFVKRKIADYVRRHTL